MIAQPARVLRLRWLAVLLLSLLWATMGSAATVAERSDFGGCAPAAGRFALPRTMIMLMHPLNCS
jgi:hypothetical protein